MATLQNIRNRAGFLVAVIGIAMLAFILGDLLTSGTTIFNKARDKSFRSKRRSNLHSRLFR